MLYSSVVISYSYTFKPFIAASVSHRWRPAFANTLSCSLGLISRIIHSLLHCNINAILVFFLSLAARPRKASSLWRPKLRVYLPWFPLPFSGQPRASRFAHANMLPIPQPQLPESHPGWLFPRWWHFVHRFRLLSASDWLNCSHIQHQYWWVSLYLF